MNGPEHRLMIEILTISLIKQQTLTRLVCEQIYSKRRKSKTNFGHIASGELDIQVKTGI